MDLDSLIKILNKKLIETNNSPLNSSQNLVLRGILNCQTYNQIAREAGYSPGYFTNVVAPELCQRLSQLIGQRVTKKNCRKLLIAYMAQQGFSKIKSTDRNLLDPFLERNRENYSSCYPSGAVGLDSPFYINRIPSEQQIAREITKPGALVRMKGPKEIGKTSLLIRTIEEAKQQNYQTIDINLEQIDRDILRDLNKFLRCLCINATYQLQLPLKLDEYWDEDLGSKISSTIYFQDYLLERAKAPVILAFDDLNLIFEYLQVAQDFLALLRSWYEEAKRCPIWQKLRLIVVNSTEIYVPLNLNQSPFNVGLTIELDDFSLQEVLQLAQRYSLNWDSNGTEAKQLMRMVNGHPALIQIALYHLKNKDISLERLLETASTSLGIYQNHLQRHWIVLQKNPQLLQAINTLIDFPESVKLDPIVAYKLSSMGLISQSQERTELRCQLYRQYFANAIDFRGEELDINFS